MDPAIASDWLSWMLIGYAIGMICGLLIGHK